MPNVSAFRSFSALVFRAVNGQSVALLGLQTSKVKAAFMERGLTRVFSAMLELGSLTRSIKHFLL